MASPQKRSVDLESDEAANQPSQQKHDNGISLDTRVQVRTPEPQTAQAAQAAQVATTAPTAPTAPIAADPTVHLSPDAGTVPPFDWDNFEARYEQALAAMNGEEKELLDEFDNLVQYFNVWASAASAHDDERAVKRLQTRERYVRIAEQSLGQRKQHLTEVVRAFQSALALLSQT